MTEDTGKKRAAADVFDEHASEYVDSQVHRVGDDLERLADWCEDAERALDIATGAGHTAGAVKSRGVPEVVATDAAPGMVATAELEFDGVDGVVADAESLPFRDSVFDAVTCRIAAHHFPNPESFVREVARVTADGGVFAFEDNIAPNDEDLDSFLNEVERLRDPTHVRSHRESEWIDWVQSAGFDVETTRVIRKEIDYQSWVEQLDTPAENRAELKDWFVDPPDGGTELYDITWEDGELVSFANLKVLLRARR